MNWEDFKDLVKEMRAKQEEIIKEYGNNTVMIFIGVLDDELKDWVICSPDGINLRTGKGFAATKKEFDNVDFKKLIQKHHWEEIISDFIIEDEEASS